MNATVAAGARLSPRARIADTVTSAGSPDRANEDALGASDNVAFVIDGATGLADTPLTEGPTDAAWLATAAVEALSAHVATGERDPKRLMEKAAETVALRFEQEKLRAPVARYEIPTAAMLIAVFEENRIRIAELGDTRLYVLADAGLADVGGLETGRDLERENAARLIAPGSTIRTPEVLEHLRKVRDLANTEAGYWVFAADPEPAKRARVHEVPLGPGGATALLLTDGLDALVANYGRTDAAGLVAAARERGLAALVDEVRHVERVEDADRKRFPRFKQSDDATAILVEVDPA